MLDVKIMNCNIKRPKKPTFTATEICNRVGIYAIYCNDEDHRFITVDIGCTLFYDRMDGTLDTFDVSSWDDTLFEEVPETLGLSFIPTWKRDHG